VGSIFDLLSLLVKIFIFGGMLMLFIKILKFRKKSDLKNEIDNLQAQISLLRISLKSKVKKKSYTFRAQFPKQANITDAVNIVLVELAENKLETGHNLQAYFDHSRQINTFIAGTVAEHVPVEDFMSNDFMNEISIIRLIKDISTLSTKLNKKIELFKISHPTANISPVDNLIFPSMVEVNRIFNDNKTVPIESETPTKAA
jgi:hypothetical protein